MHICVTQPQWANRQNQDGEFSEPIPSLQKYPPCYGDVMASQITSLTIVCSNVYSGTDQRKHQSSASLAFVRGIHQWPVNSPHKGPVTRKRFHLMTSSCHKGSTPAAGTSWKWPAAVLVLCSWSGGTWGRPGTGSPLRQWCGWNSTQHQTWRSTVSGDFMACQSTTLSLFNTGLIRYADKVC